MNDVLKEFAEWLADMLMQSWPRCLCDPQCFHLALMLSVRRPDVVVRYPKIKEFAKDIRLGIEAGSLPKPRWWDGATRKD